MALAISFISEDKNTFVVAFDNKPQINEVVDAIKDKMSQEGVMSIVDWHVGLNYAVSEDFGKELINAINQID
jgi:hypothetical protein